MSQETRLPSTTALYGGSFHSLFFYNTVKISVSFWCSCANLNEVATIVHQSLPNSHVSIGFPSQEICNIPARTV